jgi:hypothetical protein
MFSVDYYHQRIRRRRVQYSYKFGLTQQEPPSELEP